jgi:hypothetical protein
MTSSHDQTFHALVEYLRQVPAVDRDRIHTGADQAGWWIKFSIDVEHDLAWNVIQQFACNLNVSDSAPAVFKPVARSPRFYGGPGEYLSWVIECKSPDLTPDLLAKDLEEGMPQPVDDRSKWELNDG